MIRIPGNSPAAKVAIVLVAAVPIVIVWTALAILIALFGLHQVTLHTHWRVLPDWLWYYRRDPQFLGWLARGYAYGGVVVAFFTLLLLRHAGRKSLHGEARFSTVGEIERAGLFGQAGIMCGRFKGRYLRAPTLAHVELEAPTRSGKGVGVIVPTLLDWAGSSIVVDPKGENYALTAGFLAAHGVKVYRVELLNRSGRTHRFNPLSYIDRSDDREVIGELRKIAYNLFPHEPGENRFFSDKAQSAFIGVGAYVAATPELPMTIAEIYRQIIEGEPKVRLRELVNERARSDRPLSQSCVTALNDFTSANDKVFADILSSVTAKFTAFLDPLVVNATAESDFDLGAIRHERVAIFLVFQVDDIKPLSTLFGMIFQQAIRRAMDQGEARKAARHRVLLLLDEFYSLGRMPTLIDAVTVIASYGFNLLFVLQNRGQLTEVDRSKVILANCDVQIAYTPNLLDDAKEISERLGTHSVVARSENRVLGIFGKSNRSRSESEHSRALMLPQEVRTMPADDILVFTRAQLPIRAKKIKYYESNDFTSRLLPPPELPFPRGASGASTSGAVAAAATQQGVARAVELTEDQINGLAEIPLDVLEIDRDHDPFAAIERGEDAEPAAVEWFLHRLEGTSPDHGLAA